VVRWCGAGSGGGEDVFVNVHRYTGVPRPHRRTRRRDVRERCHAGASRSGPAGSDRDTGAAAGAARAPLYGMAAAEGRAADVGLDGWGGGGAESSRTVRRPEQELTAAPGRPEPELTELTAARATRSSRTGRRPGRPGRSPRTELTAPPQSLQGAQDRS
jgi:hypothetical protein